MRLDTTQQMRLVQKLAPRMIQSMEILQLPILALQERIQKELEENPSLELRDGTDDESVAGRDAADSEKPADLDAGPTADDELPDADFALLEALSRDYGEIFGEEHRPSRNGLEEAADRKHEVMHEQPSRPKTLGEHLQEQLSFLDLPEAVARRCNFLISNLDDAGYLRTPIEDLCAAYANSLGEQVTAAELEEALAVIQRLDPTGVGARNLRECLLLQIGAETPHREVLRTLIASHLDDVQHNRLPLIQKRTGLDLAVIRQAIEAMRHLNPRPGAAFSSARIPHVVPDILIEKDEQGQYTVRLLDDYIPNLYISRKCLDMLRDKSLDAKDREYIKRKVQSAQWLLDSIQQRRNTLEKVTRAIINHQKNFLEHGPDKIEPLKMQQIADQVGVHVTTVSRAVDDKWVQTPRGIFPLRRFFGGGTVTDEGEEVAWEQVKHKLLEVIANEDKANPWSDDDLKKQLERAGIHVARRTITKYRRLLKIPSSRQRKDWTLARVRPMPEHSAADNGQAADQDTHPIAVLPPAALPASTNSLE